MRNTMRTFAGVAVVLGCLASVPAQATEMEVAPEELLRVAVIPLQEVNFDPSTVPTVTLPDIMPDEVPTAVVLDVPISTTEAEPTSAHEVVEDAIRNLGYDERHGSCGYSWVYLKAASYNRGWAIAEGGFSINRPGYGYRINVRAWDPDWDSFERNYPKTGNLNGGRTASTLGEFDTPESDTYRAKLNRADVYVGGDKWCTGLGPETSEYLRR